MPAQTVEAPARIRPTHVQDRALSVVAGAPEGFRNRDWPIEVAHESGVLWRPSEKDKSKPWSPTFNGETRWIAIREYAEWTDLAELRSGKDSTQLDVVKGGSGYPIAEAQSDAIKKLVATDSRLNSKDRTICHKLAEGHTLAGAVREACGDDFVFAVRPRVRDALDSLIEAMRSAKRAGYTFDMRTP